MDINFVLYEVVDTIAPEVDHDPRAVIVDRRRCRRLHEAPAYFFICQAERLHTIVESSASPGNFARGAEAFGRVPQGYPQLWTTTAGHPSAQVRTLASAASLTPYCPRVSCAGNSRHNSGVAQQTGHPAVWVPSAALSAVIRTETAILTSPVPLGGNRSP